MTVCNDLSDTLRALADSFGWRCRPLPGSDQVVELLTGRTWSDNEPVRLRVRMDDSTTIVASDGGEVLRRLRDAGAEPDDETFAALWAEALYTYRLQEMDDRLYLQVELPKAAHALNRLADALVAFDALQLTLVPVQAKGLSLADEVEHWLRGLGSIGEIRTRPTVKLGRGLTVRPSLEVRTPQRSVLVQASATSNRVGAYEHAFTMFSLAHRAQVRPDERLTVLGGNVASWSWPRLQVLSEFTYVAFWGDREPIRRFFNDGDVPEQRILVPARTPLPLEP